MIKGKLKTGQLFLIVVLLISPLYAESPVNLFEQGNDALDDGNCYLALDYYKQALEINPGYVDALMGISRAYFLLQEYDEALSYIVTARIGATRRIDVLNLEGRINLGLSELDEAERIFNQVLKIEPNNMDASYGLAEIAVFRGNYKEGSDLFEKSLAINPDSRRALLSLSVLYLQMDQPERAESYLASALKLFPQDRVVLREAMSYYVDAEDWEKAENLALQFLSLEPENKDIALVLGMIYKNTGIYDKAVEFFQESIRHQQENPLTWYHLGWSFYGLGKYDEALLCFKTVNIIDPNDEISRISAENLLMRFYPLNHAERNTAALWHFERGRKLQDNYQFAKAFDEYRRGRLLAPLNLDGWWSYARILDTMDQPNRFRDELEALNREAYDNIDFKRLYELVMSTDDQSYPETWEGSILNRDSSLSLSLFVDTTRTEMIHQGGEEDLTRFVGDSLMKNPRFSIMESIPVKSASDAYRSARNSGSDFYLVLAYTEMERSIRLRCELYLSRTGTLIDSFDLLRSGNMRVREILIKAAVAVETRLPLKGHLMGVEGNDVLINLGSLSQVEEDMSFILLRRGSGRWLDAEPYRDYQAEDVLGTVVITEVQENTSKGILKRNSPFDLVNPGDEVYTLPENSEEQEELPESMNSELKTQLLRLY